ncbi:Exoglucanase 1 [Colletotrichum trifolii]|uniref:Glucanase n=1 Tax=Colletotrichum trifolii TaxID=5466 RepID=A0A4R8RUA3_COLTR|nr:Exoglucanase 1 [Colletotrichum trifolii]
MRLLIATFLGALATAQKIGHFVPEVHPALSWSRCTSPGSCDPVNGAVTIDAAFRFTHLANSAASCFVNNRWTCGSAEACSEQCVLEGEDYGNTLGVTARGASLSQRYKTAHQFGRTVNSRLFLLDEARAEYQTFTLLGNELAFDVDLSLVPCGLNSAIHFLDMDADGGMAKNPGNEAGARYGTGYCNAECTRSNLFVQGQANSEGWQPHESGGEGKLGACCSTFDVWNSNSQSFQTQSRPCSQNGLHGCTWDECDQIRISKCAREGCEYNPYRLGATGFYGQGKTVDTKKKFTVVTRFAEDRVTKFFIQDGVKIEAPVPTKPNFPGTAGLDEDFCDVLPRNFDELDKFNQHGGWARHIDVLRRPLVMALSIQDDFYANNLWLDSYYPRDSWSPGAARGPCPNDSGHATLPWVDPAKENVSVTWSNIRFGPIGSTVDV